MFRGRRRDAGWAVETDAHLILKRHAVTYLRRAGCQAVATEVRCPISRYRVDVAGYLDTHPAPAAARGRARCRPRTIVIECKQSRGDFLRDGRDRGRLLELRDELERLRRHIEEHRIKAHEPDLRRSAPALFPELEVWDFNGSRLPGYRDLLRRLRRLEMRIHGETKFFMLARYRLADHLYLAAPPGMIRCRELPRGWGLLEVGRRGLPPRVIVEAPPRESREDFRFRLLRNIAVAASRTVRFQDAGGVS